MDYIKYSDRIRASIQEYNIIQDCFQDYRNRITKDVKDAVNSIYGVYGRNRFDIKKVYFRDPVTVVLWEDGSKTIVKRDERDTYDAEKALAMAIAKKALCNKGNYYNVFKKWIPEKHDSNAEQCHMNDKIVHCEIVEGRFVNRVFVYYDNGSNNCIGTYYPDELQFSQKDFIGLTEKEAYDLIAATDKKYLRG